MEKRTARMIDNPKDVNFLLSLNEDTITSSVIMDILGQFDDKPPRFNPYDLIEIPAGVYGNDKTKNKTKFITTVGLWLFNRLVIERDLFHLFGYINEVVDGDKIEDINKHLSWALMEDRIDVDVMNNYIKKQQLIMTYVSFLAPNHSMDMLTCTKDIDKKKKELIKKHEKELAANDGITMNNIEKELLAYSKDLLKDDPAMDTYNSGARASFGNHFKNMYVLKGQVKNPDPNKGYDFITSSYTDGVSKEDYTKLCNNLIEGPYKRGKKTEVGGMWEKQFMAAFQHLVIGPKESDCKTKRYVEIVLTKKNVGDWMYNYIVEGSKLVELTSQNMDKYLGKKVKFRFASQCESKDYICHKCAGNMWYRLDITNIGASTPQLAALIKLKSMKAFHDGTVQYADVDLASVFGD